MTSASSPHRGRHIRRDDLLGRSIVRLWSHQWTQGGLNFHMVIIELDSGLRFSLPRFPDEPFGPAELTPDFRLSDPAPDLTAPIVALLRPRDDGDFCPGSTHLVLGNGIHLVEDACEPHGVAAAGVVATRSPRDAHDLIDFFAVG